MLSGSGCSPSGLGKPVTALCGVAAPWHHHDASDIHWQVHTQAQAGRDSDSASALTATPEQALALPLLLTPLLLGGSVGGCLHGILGGGTPLVPLRPPAPAGQEGGPNAHLRRLWRAGAPAAPLARAAPSSPRKRLGRAAVTAVVSRPSRRGGAARARAPAQGGAAAPAKANRRRGPGRARHTGAACTGGKPALRGR